MDWVSAAFFSGQIITDLQDFANNENHHGRRFAAGRGTPLMYSPSLLAAVSTLTVHDIVVNQVGACFYYSFTQQGFRPALSHYDQTSGDLFR